MAAAAHRGPLPAWFESRSFSLSLLLHLGLILVAAFGLPFILPKKSDPVPMVMTVEVLPISAMTNIKPSQEPITQKQEIKAPEVKKVEPPKPVDKPQPPKPAPAEKIEDKPFDPTEGAEKIVKKEAAKEESKKEDKTFEQMMADLNKEAKKSTPEAADKNSTPENKTKSDAPYDASLPLSISEQDAIRNQFIPCWSPPMGAKDAANLVVVLKAQYKQDGTLIDVVLRPDLQGRYASDAFFKAAADAALRAVHRCELKSLDPSKYGAWKDMELTFDPKAYF